MVAQQNLHADGYSTLQCVSENPGEILRVSWKDTAVPGGEEFIASPGCWHLEMCCLPPAVQSGCTVVVTEQIRHVRFHLSCRLGKAKSFLVRRLCWDFNKVKQILFFPFAPLGLVQK